MQAFTHNHNLDLHRKHAQSSSNYTDMKMTTASKGNLQINIIREKWTSNSMNKSNQEQRSEEITLYELCLFHSSQASYLHNFLFDQWAWSLAGVSVHCKPVTR